MLCKGNPKIASGMAMAAVCMQRNKEILNIFGASVAENVSEFCSGKFSHCGFKQRKEPSHKQNLRTV